MDNLLTRRRSFLFVRLKEATEESYVFVSKSSRLLIGALIFLFVIFLFIVIFIEFAEGGGLSTVQLSTISIFFLALVAVILLVPFTEMFIINKPRKYFMWRRETLANKLGMGEPREESYSFNSLGFSWQHFPGANPLIITSNSNEQYALNFRVKREQLEEFETWLVGPREEEEQPEEEIAPLIKEEKTSQQYLAMQKEIKSWGISSLVLGIVHLVSFGFLDPSWGVALLLVGLFSFIFKDAAIFVLYAVTLVWVGLSNIIYTGFGYWMFFGFLQIYWGYGLYKKFRQYQDVEKEHLPAAEETGGEESKPSRAAKYFPGVGCALSAIGLVSYVGLFVFIIFLIALQPPGGGELEVSDTANFIFRVVVGLGMLGFSVSLAALLSKYKPKWLAWGGVIAGGLVVLLEIIFFFL